MRRYDPDVAPSATTWLDTDELERLRMVEAYHRRARIPLPNPRLHAIVHVIVETQLAMGESAVVDALAHLRQEGMGRHDALHAIGSVLAEHMHRLMQRPTKSPHADVNQPYFDALRRLTAPVWLRSAQPGATA